MSHPQNYHEFTALPVWTAPQWAGKGATHRIVNDSDPYKWSGRNAPPAIGAHVKVFMNRLGTGTVVGYFAEYGWLGVLVKPDKPPKWWRQQNPNATEYHTFGLDLEPRVKMAS